MRSAASPLLLALALASASAFVVRRSPGPFHPAAPPAALRMSLRPLVDSLLPPPSGSSRTKILFVGGKGGVGKTTVSSAVAVHLASLPSSDGRVLLLSTDPAHSLGDALDASLTGTARTLDDPVTAGRLDAMEVDAAGALDSFRAAAEAFDPAVLASSLGVDASLLAELGLDEMSEFLADVPPGLDEFVALADALSPALEGGEYDVVVVDTAPTGHTLRMLALPEFLDGFLGKLLALRARLGGLAQTIQSVLGGGEAAGRRADAVGSALSALESFRGRIGAVRELLADDERTSFLVVTVPTALGAAESKRLMQDLGQKGMAVSGLVANQCVGGMAGPSAQKYYDARSQGQSRWIAELRVRADEVSASPEYQNNVGEGGGGDAIAVTEVPFRDTEVVGPVALAALGAAAFADARAFEHLVRGSYGGGTAGADARVVVCGGKGGVGKTTSSAALALTMAAAGHRVALVSTDPAHSVGDALAMDLAGGEPVDVPLPSGTPGDGALAALEVDPEQAVREFRGLVDDFLGDAAAGGGNGGGGGLADTLKDLGGIFDTLPAGTDEVVALAKVIGLVKKGGYDRIVLDTAPTGHTLRMLSTPGFLAGLIDRVLAISKKINANAAVRMLLATTGNAGKLDETTASARAALVSFQLRMYDLEDMFGDPDQTEFLVVTVPTELATRETLRLVNDLTYESPDLPIRVRNVVVNQVLPEGQDGAAENFLQRVGVTEARVLKELEGAVAGENTEITRVGYLDVEPRGVYGLMALSQELLREEVPVP